MERKGSSMEGRERVFRDKRLYELCRSGSVPSLNELMKEDELTLARGCVTCFDETPLHIAVMLGHEDFVTALLSHKPDLVTKSDSQERCPLHWASSNGYVEIVKKLLWVNSGICLERDKDGRTPLHLAVKEGRVEVVKELVRVKPEVIGYKLDRDETLLHSCVKYKRWEALKVLLESGRVDDDFINATDEDGNTILHMATALKHVETIRYLLSRTGVKVNAVNGNGSTALDFIERMPRDLEGMEISESLQNAGALTARKIPASACRTDQVIRGSEALVVVNPETAAPPSDVPLKVTVARPPSRGSRFILRIKNKVKKQLKKHEEICTKKEDWLDKTRDALMIAASVIAAMAYQAGLSPPGGVWQQDGEFKDNNNNTMSYIAGTSVMADKDPYFFSIFWLCNTVSFIASLSTILLLVSGLPLKRRIVMWILMVAMWVTLSFMALTYLNSMTAIGENARDEIIINVASTSLFIWLGVIGIIFLAHTVRFLIWCVRKVKKHRKKRLSSNVTEGQGNV